MKKRTDFESTPIINYVYNWTADEIKKLQDELMIMHCAHHHDGIKAVEWMKLKLGRQNYVYNGEFRFWVWEQNKWRVYVSNHKGICFEVTEGLSKEEVLEQWHDYLNKLKLKKSNK